MASEQPNEASIFNAARKIESADESEAFLEKTCGDDQALRQRVEKLLATYVEESQYLEQPAAELEATIAPEESGRNRSASLDAGLATAFSTDKAVVLGDKNHSVLKMLGQTLGSAPNVVLRDPADGGTDPITQPKSPEIPNTDSDDRYRFDGEIARGGMGAILKGRDNDLGRDLAIKVLLDSHKDNPQVVQRFVEEAQIGGQLQHPGIAPIYELGQFADQRPFFAMKLVKGETLAKLLADRNDPVAERSKFVGIFEQVCQTMAYAHSRSVIHRDLKPANIMVGAFGEVQVMDWGLAKVLPSGGVADEKQAQSKHKHKEVSVIQTRRSAGSDTPGSAGSGGSGGSGGSDTQMGSVMGTPAYMPPEQALGEIDQLDQRADVFGLGAILCEILTGKPPYVGEDSTQVFRLASRGKLDDAFSRLDDCGADAELVTLAKDCLAVEPAERPRDASVLAQQVTTYLESVEQKLRETELAKVDAQVRAEELSRRQRLALTAGTAILATLVVGISMSLWQMIRANNAEELATNEANRATAAERVAREEADKATAAEQKTAETLVAVAAERDEKELARKEAADISTFLTDILQSPDPTRDGREIKVAELLDNAAKKLETDLADQPGQRARMQNTLGSTYNALGLYREAIAIEEQVRDYHLANSGSTNPKTIGAMHNLAISYRFGGQLDDALRLGEEVLQLSRKWLAANHPTTLSATNNLAGCYFTTGNFKKAVKMYEEVLPLYSEVFGPKDPSTLMVKLNLASSYGETGRPDKALQLAKEVLPLNQKVLGSEHPDTLDAMSNLATCYHKSGYWNEALELWEKVLPLCLKVLGPEHPDTLLVMDRLATAYQHAGRWKETLKLRVEALEPFRKVFGPKHHVTLALMHNLAIAYGGMKRHSAAVKLGEEVLELRREELGPEHPDTLTSWQNLMLYLRAAGRHDEALKLQEELLPVQHKVFGTEHPETLRLMTNVASYYDAVDRNDEALKLREELVATSRKVRGSEHPYTLQLMSARVDSYIEAGRKDDALKLQREIVPLCRKRLGPSHYQTLGEMTNLASNFANVGRLSEAVALQEKTLALKRQAIPDHPYLTVAINHLATLYVRSGHPEKALPLLTELLDYCVGKSGDSSRALTVAALQAWFSDDVEYQLTRKRMLGWAKDTDIRADADQVTRLSCLRPIEVAESRKSVLELGQKSVTLGQDDNEALPWSRLALGMAEYRNAQYVKAAKTLITASESASDTNDEDDDARITGTANFYRAMCLFHGGKKDDARALFTATAAKMKPLPADDKNPHADDVANHDDLVLWLAYKEAKALITDESSIADPDKADTADKQPDAGAKSKKLTREN